MSRAGWKREAQKAGAFQFQIVARPDTLHAASLIPTAVTLAVAPLAMPLGAQAPVTPDELTIMSKYDPRACALENVKFQTDEQMGLKAVPRIAAPKPPRGSVPAVAASPKYAADFARGYTEANARIAAIVGDARVKGHERAAIDLAIAAPAMSVEALSAFVGDHAAATSGAALSSVRFGSLSALRASPESETSSDEPGNCGGLAAAVSGLIGNDQL